MKKTFITFLTAAASCLFADVPSPSFPAPDTLQGVKMPAPEMVLSKQGYFYLRFMTADSDLIHANTISPGMGIGYRRLAGDGAIDISINGNGSSHFTKSCWTFPKASYLHYLNPNGKQSPYIGAGLAWGGVHPERKTDFIGIIPSATIGYEFAHKSPLIGFVEMNISQPAIPVDYRGRFPGPIAELSIGGGF